MIRKQRLTQCLYPYTAPPSRERYQDRDPGGFDIKTWVAGKLTRNRDRFLFSHSVVENSQPAIDVWTENRSLTPITQWSTFNRLFTFYKRMASFEKVSEGRGRFWSLMILEKKKYTLLLNILVAEKHFQIGDLLSCEICNVGTVWGPTDKNCNSGLWSRIERIRFNQLFNQLLRQNVHT